MPPWENYQSTAPAIPDAVTAGPWAKYGAVEKAPPPQTDPGLGRTALDQSLQGASFGFADEATDALGALGARAYTAYKNNAPKALGGDPGAYDGESLAGTMQDARAASKSRMQQEWQQHPVASIASNIAGGLATGKIMGATNAGEAIGSSIGSGGFSARIAKGAAAGAASGGIYGAGSADDGNRLEGAEQGAKYGAAFGAAAPVVGAVASGVKNEIQSLLPHAAQSADELRQAASPLYDSFTKSGGVYSDKLTNEIADLADAAKSTGIAGQQKPADEALNKALDFYSSLRGAKLSPEDLQKLDQSFTDDVSRFNRAGEYNFGRKLNDLKYEMRGRAFDPQNSTNYIESGNPQAVNDLLQANKLWSQSYKAKDVEKILQKAQGTENPQTSIRTGIKNLLANDKKMVGYSDQDKAILQDAMKRGVAGGLVKLLGGRLIDSVAGGVAGLAAGGPVGAIGGAVAGKAVGGIMADAAGGIQANRLRGALQSIQSGAAQGTTPVASGLMPSMIGGQAGGRIGAPQAMPQGMSMPPTSLPDVQLPQLGLPPQVNAQPQSAPQQMGNALLDRISQAESGGNSNAQASTSSASGEYQFTDPTWKAMVAKHPEAGMTVADKSNPDAQKKMAALLLQDNTQSLQSSLGRQPSDGELYIAHFLGAPKAAKLINHADDGVSAASMFPKAAAANKKIFYHNGQPLTTGQVYAKLLAKVES